jgi:glycosyltransferase involved in cell wall biosynthesis
LPFGNISVAGFALEIVMQDLSIIMPCLNEAATLGNCILKAKKSIEALKLDGEIIVADNGSTHGSIEIATNMGARVVSVKEKGYGNALRGGIEAAIGKWIIIADADDSYDFSQIAPFAEKLQAGCDLVMGCRLPKGAGEL